MYNIEDEIFGTDEGFEQRLNEFKDRCGELCSNFLSKHLKLIFALPVLFLSFAMLLVGAITIKSDLHAGVILIIYSFSSFCCSLICSCFQRGCCGYSVDNPEKKRLLSLSCCQNNKQSSQMSLENVMEPRQGGGIFEARSPYQGAYEVHRSDIYEPLNNDDTSPSPSHAKSFPKLIYGENSVGTSSTPDPFPTLNYDETSAGAPRTAAKASGTAASEDATSSQSFENIIYSFAPTQSTESSDLEEPTQRRSQARLSSHGIRTFGAPLHVYGADKYTVFDSSDERSFESSTSSGDARKVKTLEVSAEVHHDTRRQISSSNDGSSSGEPASMASDETALTAVSDHGDSSRQISSSSSGEPASMASDETGLTPVSDLHDNIPGSDLQVNIPFHVHKVKSFEGSVEVHPDSSRPISSDNDGSSSGEPASMASDETALTPVSDMPYIDDDDQSSESTCSTHLDEQSSKTEDKC